MRLASAELNLNDAAALAGGSVASPARRGDRAFRVSVLLAALAHLMLLVSFYAAPVKRLGDESGAEDGISVSLVDAATPKGDATIADSAAGAAPTPEIPPQATRPPTPEPTPPDPPQPRQETAAAAPPSPAEQTPPTPAPTPPQQPAAEAQPEPPRKLAEAKIEPIAPNDSAAKPARQQERPQEKSAPPKDAKPHPAKPRPTQTAKTELAPPPAPPVSFPSPAGSAGGGVERPPGITRSGENDAFARGVIRALQRTMPQLANTYGRVTVRITLDMNGNLVSTQVIRPSSVAGLDQNVLFATKQSSFPLPPRNAQPVDLIFIVTYVYR